MKEKLLKTRTDENFICFSVGVAYDARIGGKFLSLGTCNDTIGCLFYAYVFWMEKLLI